MKITVNNEELDSALVEQEIERLRPDYERYIEENQADPPEGQLEEWANENIIERMVMMQAAAKMDAEIPAEQIDEAFEEVKENIGDTPEDEVRAEIALQIKLDMLMQQAVADVKEPTDKELKAFYSENLEMFVRPEQVRASHIIKHVNPNVDRETAFGEIVEIQNQLNAGTPFEELASQHSDCPDSAGDLGFFERGQMVEEFENVAFAMKVGDISDIFLTDFGYHIVKLNEHVPGGAVPLEDVQEQLSEHLTEQARSQAVEVFIDDLKSKAEIVRNEE
ncbi:MAG: peptidylprolyl isomerase [Phycisphaerae bacterium]|jgi:parvulin-like peptidyl-prolyl isomerase|nr:peptidylprolyl isomerase [Phycisphaerae bacterium]